MGRFIGRRSSVIGLALATLLASSPLAIAQTSAGDCPPSPSDQTGSWFENLTRVLVSAGQSGLVLSGATKAAVPIVEEVAPKILDVPGVVQKGGTCVFYAFNMVSKYFDGAAAPAVDDLISEAVTKGLAVRTVEKGVETVPLTLGNLARLAADHGYVVERIGNVTRDTFKTAIAAGHVPITFFDVVKDASGTPTTGLGRVHAAVVEGFKTGANGVEEVVAKHGWRTTDYAFNAAEFDKSVASVGGEALVVKRGITGLTHAAAEAAEHTAAEGGAKAASRALARFAPGLNVAMAVVDTGIAFHTLMDPHASGLTKTSAVVTAAGSILAATNIPIVSQVGAGIAVASSFIPVADSLMGGSLSKGFSDATSTVAHGAVSAVKSIGGFFGGL